MMNIKINYISDFGIPNKERAIFKVHSADNVGRYIALKTTEVLVGRINSNPSNFYWFPNQDVKTGDFIVLYTGNGVNTKFSNKFGTTTFVFYWGLPKTILNAPKDSIVLIGIDGWEYKSRTL